MQPVSAKAATDNIDDVLMERIGNRQVDSYLNKSLVSLTDETFYQSLFNGPENIQGYSIYGTKGIVGNTFNRNIFLLEATGEKGVSGFRQLIGSLETEALKSRADKISIYGAAVINKGFLNPNIAARFGYSFKSYNSGVLFKKTLIP